jgi:hypothetical protein
MGWMEFNRQDAKTAKELSADYADFTDSIGTRRRFKADSKVVIDNGSFPDYF